MTRPIADAIWRSDAPGYVYIYIYIRERERAEVCERVSERVSEREREGRGGLTRLPKQVHQGVRSEAVGLTPCLTAQACMHAPSPYGQAKGDDHEVMRLMMAWRGDKSNIGGNK